MAVVAFAHGGGPGTGWYRVDQPARWLSAHGVECRVLHPRNEVDRGVLQGVTTFVLQRATSLGAMKAVAHLRDRGVRVVYEIDDDLWRLPSWNPARAQYTPEVLGHIENVMRQCNAVTVSTESLGARVEGLGCDDVFVIPNGVPLDLVPPRAMRTRPGVRVGWFGTRTHQGDLALVIPALQRLVKEWAHVTLVLMGDTLPGLWPVGRVETYQGVHPTGYYGALQKLELDIVLAPLVDNDFNRAKSPVKALEAGAIGAAIAASNVGPYRQHLEHGHTALLANTGEDWESNLFTMVDDIALRESLATAARQWVEQKGSMESTGPIWRAVLA